MTDPVAVGRALKALADSDAPREPQPPTDVVAAARDAFSDISTAARFLDDGGEVTLRRAVGTAARNGHDEWAREGSALLSDLSRLREALDADESTQIRDADHFQSGRTTVFSSGGEPADR
ncbi:hypothetical protein E6P09_07130 [Haloferax mediterranei ATCC 33500]|uniref:Uncharacterized protein n=1 Tax=Haloferax mediterranei (strain ATCC 33500 / DSM 1411 / JCM 8866 / NBRC 14739 / NCIMB 2177 / R-4) TaxID=523841 RepID=I3R2T2_HALMT|nr:hypothetical protein [Haloferax mediterranei]AFK18542.1 hypothetical protein HFX_0820 [Haloferax mediterranei ATCC 33500]AHZ22079.1 hypothetical protein BM92_05135 [Haloferax mediterranei ATCC 33500]EMA02183.1 hypothetical protein C439_06370 [Haloferax mediterranei ATCC 33500]MDX5988633.1 hypothetical protein [Haloferax mediterranei ATCC 33500]QCQ75047.1 hypothetical protein E6P09_07130 [Haloferax mediterranei ATCC 33500]